MKQRPGALVPNGGLMWSRLLDDGRAQCLLCPHGCRLRDGQRGICYARVARGGRVEPAFYGRISGMAVDPIEKKPLYHFLPGSRSLSFGSIGCNLSCRFCQNWHISQPEDESALIETATPEAIAEAAVRLRCPSVSFTYNEPIVTCEFTCDTARACHDRGIRTVAVTAGYIEPGPAREFFGLMDAANVDLKSFRDDFYRRLCGARLQPVLDALELIRRETACRLEVTTLLIPGANDSEAEIAELAGWVLARLGPDVPVHFSAFHPMHRLADAPPTPPRLVRRAREMARGLGLHHVYTGNIADDGGGDTLCPRCGRTTVARSGFCTTSMHLTPDGACGFCGADCAVKMA